MLLNSLLKHTADYDADFEQQLYDELLLHLLIQSAIDVMEISKSNSLVI